MKTRKHTPLEIFHMFEKYHKQNPKILKAFPMCIAALKRAKWKRISTTLIFEWFRNSGMLVDIDGKQWEFKIDNCLRSMYLHALVQWMPSMKNEFIFKEDSAGYLFRQQIVDLLTETKFVIGEAEAIAILKPETRPMPSLFHVESRASVNLATGEI